MTSFDVFRVGKVKTVGGIAAMCGHWTRSRPTPNADPARSDLNRILVGSGDVAADCQSLLDRVDGKPRKEAVLAIEAVCTASREAFTDKAGNVDIARVDAWAEAKMTWLQSEFGDRLAGAVLHLDETTPHIHAAVVPLKIGKNGKISLSARDLTGSPDLLRGLQDRSAAAVQHLGIERGRKGSTAEHTEIREFYAELPARAAAAKRQVREDLARFRDGVRERLAGEVKTTRQHLAAERAETAQELAKERKQVQTQRTEARSLLQTAENRFQEASRARAEARGLLAQAREVVDKSRELVGWVQEHFAGKWESIKIRSHFKRMEEVEDRAKALEPAQASVPMSGWAPPKPF